MSTLLHFMEAVGVIAAICAPGALWVLFLHWIDDDEW